MPVVLRKTLPLSLVHSNLASVAEEAGDGGTAFAAGTLEQPQEGPPRSPRISRNETTLFLDAAPLDTVGGIILVAENFLNSHALLTIDPLIRFLQNVAGLTHAHLPSDGASFDAVVTALASSLSSSSSSDIDANSMTAEDVDQSPLLPPPEK